MKTKRDPLLKLGTVVKLRGRKFIIVGFGPTNFYGNGGGNTTIDLALLTVIKTKGKRGKQV